MGIQMKSMLARQQVLTEMDKEIREGIKEYLHTRDKGVLKVLRDKISGRLSYINPNWLSNMFNLYIEREKSKL